MSFVCVCSHVSMFLSVYTIPFQCCLLSQRDSKIVQINHLQLGSQTTQKIGGENASKEHKMNQSEKKSSMKLKLLKWDHYKRL